MSKIKAKLIIVLTICSVMTLITWAMVIISLVENTSINTCRTFNKTNLTSKVNQIDMQQCAPTCTINSGAQVVENSFFKISLNTSGLYIKPRKYRVIVRVDPRFPNALTFVAKYSDDISATPYKPNWQQLMQYNSLSPSDSNNFNQIITGLLNYYNSSTIPVNSGDIISIRQIDITEFYDSRMMFFSSDSAHSFSNPVYISTSSGGLDNCILSANDRNMYDNKTSSSNFINAVYTGTKNGGTATCANASLCNNLTSVNCIWNQGTGITIGINNQIKKQWNNPFVNIGTTQYPVMVYYLSAAESGNLFFGYGFNIHDTINYGNNQSFQMLNDVYTSYPNLSSSAASNLIATVSAGSVDHFFGGRYLLEIEVGASNPTIFQQRLSDMKIDYTIRDNSVIKAQGSAFGLNNGANASDTGELSYIITNPYPDIGGTLLIVSEAYTNSIKFSDLLYNRVITPLKSQILDLSRALFNTIASNATFRIIANAFMILAVMIYGVGFSLGSINAKAKDLTIFIFKILIVSTVISPEGWSFFNEYLFSIFIVSTDALMIAVTDSTGSVNNPFGFIDPILQKYFNPDLWFIIFVYLAWWPLGYIIPGLLMGFGIGFFVWSFVEVVVTYLIAFWCTCVLIALAPIFIIFILFKQTSNMFQVLLSTLFCYVLQPLFALIFILFIDQISTNILQDGWQVCFGCVLDMNFSFVQEIPYIGFSIDAPCLNTYSPTPKGVVNIFRMSLMLCMVMGLMQNVLSMSQAMANALAQTNNAGVTSSQEISRGVGQFIDQSSYTAGATIRGSLRGAELSGHLAYNAGRFGSFIASSAYRYGRAAGSAMYNRTSGIRSKIGSAYCNFRNKGKPGKGSEGKSGVKSEAADNNTEDSS
ncbi:MAG: type IV secretion system protein [Alphaproteobacteria bacterium]|nr:type IV secretion system protein [Alphaproteobacteria bacterium]